ncbi:hypothetical protein KSP40_PGU016059 [Platanthera guangdongensis]|uniref:Uncharacterized protein n=1 Tax=Platanthera guangdongensis TaxID=2320717 RepID=A0ABR2N4B5_9ASPA
MGFQPNYSRTLFKLYYQISETLLVPFFSNIPNTIMPSLTLLFSNALVAAFKRAQAHQRGGLLVESQQKNPLLITVKIEPGQLIISILDDPSVSGVMREAGFSNTQVKSLKTNIEKAIIPYSDACAFTAHAVKAAMGIESEDILDSFLEILSARKKKSIVVVRDSLAAAAQAAVRRLMDRHG